MTSQIKIDEEPISQIVGDACPYCADGTLKRGTYKDNDAAVCENCGTPSIQVF